MNIEQARFNMVEQQIRTWEVLDQKVLDSLYVVRREEFVPAAYRALAFSDLEIPLSPDEGEKMLQPKVEARIVQEVAPKPHERVLEIGSGSGYLSALLAHHAQHVHGAEISPRLKALAETNLAKAGVRNASIEEGDASQGWSAHAPYDIIVLGASTPVLPDSLLAQLKPGGRLFAIVGEAPVMQARLYTCIAAGSYNSTGLFETVVAPLKHAQQRERFQF
jgi:protein-L-isoaspartate(D-aspartate) O-methyltransferase